MIRIHTQGAIASRWLERFRGRRPPFVCVLGFTETGLLPGISAAGATPSDRQYTALADAEFLYNGPTHQPCYPLPPLVAGASPVLISRAVVTEQRLPLTLLNTGLPYPLPVPHVPLAQQMARCVSTGQAMAMDLVQHLFHQGWQWGEQLAQQDPDRYLVVSECVVGGTTTALAVLLGMGIAAEGKVNSSHPTCNHDQKRAIALAGLTQAQPPPDDPWRILAAVGDPMQAVVAGMTLGASQTSGVLLAGGTQMLAVYALTQAIAHRQSLPWQPQNIVVGTTRWVTDDPSGDTVGLAALLDAPLLSTALSFAPSVYAQLRAYEQGFVKEGVGAGGAAIAAHLHQDWSQDKLLTAIEQVAAQLQFCQQTSHHPRHPMQGAQAIACPDEG